LLWAAMCCACPVGVDRDQVQAPERPAANLRGVVLDEAAVTPGAGEGEVLTAVALADRTDHDADGISALQTRSSIEPSG